MLLNSSPNRAGIFVFYDPDGIVDQYVLTILDDLIKNLSTLIIICNGILTSESKKKLLYYTKFIYVRENTGFDAAAYRDGFTKYLGWEKIGQYDEIVILNDTFYGPFYPFFQVFLEMATRDIDFWGLTEHQATIDFPAHIQTYFVVFRKSVIKNREFQRYWEEIPDYKNFQDVVMGNEVTLTNFLKKLGFQSDVYINDQNLYSLNKANVCNYAFLPRTMLLENGYNILKRKNFSLDQCIILSQTEGEELRNALNYIEKNTSYDVNQIWDNILRLYAPDILYQSLHLNYIISCDNILPDIQLNKNILCIILCNTRERIAEIGSILKIVDFFMEVKILSANYDIYCETKLLYPNTNCLYSLQKNWWESIDGFDYVCVIDDLIVDEEFESNVSRISKFNRQQSNLIADQNYIRQVIEIFEKNPRLGILAVSFSSRDYFCTDNMKKNVKNYFTIDGIIEKKGDFYNSLLMPTYSGWYRSSIFINMNQRKPIDKCMEAVFSYAMPYIAQSRGYYTACLYNKDYAELEISNYRYMFNSMNEILQILFPHIKLMDLININYSMKFQTRKKLYLLIRLMIKMLMPKSIYNFLKKNYKNLKMRFKHEKRSYNRC